MVEQEKECAVEREYEQDDNLEQERLESADQECGVGNIVSQCEPLLAVLVPAREHDPPHPLQDHAGDLGDPDQGVQGGVPGHLRQSGPGEGA